MNNSISCVIFYLWVFFFFLPNMTLEENNFCFEHEDCLLLQADRILFVILVACDLD